MAHEKYPFGTIWCCKKSRWIRMENPTWKYIGEAIHEYFPFPKKWIKKPHKKDIK